MIVRAIRGINAGHPLFVEQAFQHANALVVKLEESSTGVLPVE
jgi:hypothetical protein